MKSILVGFLLLFFHVLAHGSELANLKNEAFNLNQTRVRLQQQADAAYIQRFAFPEESLEKLRDLNARIEKIDASLEVIDRKIQTIESMAMSSDSGKSTTPAPRPEVVKRNGVTYSNTSVTQHHESPSSSSSGTRSFWVIILIFTIALVVKTLVEWIYNFLTSGSSSTSSGSSTSHQTTQNSPFREVSFGVRDTSSQPSASSAASIEASRLRSINTRTRPGRVDGRMNFDD